MNCSQMNEKMTDCVIIGGGIIGMLTAHQLALQGVRIHLLERQTSAQESSWAGGGILSPLYPWRYDDAVTALANWSQREYQTLCANLEAQTGIDPEWIESGLLMLDCTEADKALPWAAKHHHRIEQLNPTAITALEPALQFGTHALYMPAIAQLRNPRLLHALRNKLIALGVRIENECAVTRLDIRNHRIHGVVTHQHTIACQQAVIAMGSWSPQLLTPHGIDIDIRPVRGQMLLFRAKPGQLRHIVMSEGKYLIPRRDGRILAGSTVEFSGYDKTTTQAAYDSLHQAACAMLPALAATPVERHWAGLRPGAARGIPYIGPIATIAGLYINAGHFRNGVVTGLASAQLLCDLMLNQPPIIDPAPYQVAGRQPGSDTDWI